MYHLVVYETGPSWVLGHDRRDQPGWPDHAVFMNRLEDKGIAVLGGPLSGTDTVPVVMRGPTRSAFAGARRRRPVAHAWHFSATGHLSLGRSYGRVGGGPCDPADQTDGSPFRRA